MKLLPISSERTLEKCNEYQDFGTLTVFIASYPKSGTTWLQSICYHLLLKNIEKSGNSSLPHLNHISDYAPFYEIDKTWDPCANDARLLAKYDEAHAKLNCRLFNTHLLPHMLPLESSSSARAIYVVRQARDVAFSFYHHLSNQDEESGGSSWASFEEFLDSWMEGDLPYSKWTDHLGSWLSYILEQKERRRTEKGKNAAEKILLLTYEELCRDLPSSLQKICRHLELSLTRGDVEDVVPQLTFDGMRKETSKYQPVSVAWKPGYNFLRKGVVNDSYALFYDAKTGTPTAVGLKYLAVMRRSLQELEGRHSQEVIRMVSSLSDECYPLTESN